MTSIHRDLFELEIGSIFFFKFKKKILTVDNISLIYTACYCRDRKYTARYQKIDDKTIKIIGCKCSYKFSIHYIRTDVEIVLLTSINFDKINVL